MKTQILLIAMIFAAAALPISAQSDDTLQLRDPALGTATTTKLETAKKNYLMGLRSDNEGVLESSMYYALRMRLAYPELEMNAISREIDRLTNEGQSSSIRYKAHIASTIFAAPSLVDTDLVATATDIPSYFVALSHQLQQQLLVQNR